MKRIQPYLNHHSDALMKNWNRKWAFIGCDPIWSASRLHENENYNGIENSMSAFMVNKRELSLTRMAQCQQSFPYLQSFQQDLDFNVEYSTFKVSLNSYLFYIEVISCTLLISLEYMIYQIIFILQLKQLVAFILLLEHHMNL